MRIAAAVLLFAIAGAAAARTAPFVTIIRSGDPAPGLTPTGNVATGNSVITNAHVANYVPGITPIAGPSARFTARTAGGSGHYLWRPGSGIEFVYQVDVTPAPMPPYTAGQTVGSMGFNSGCVLPSGLEPFVASAAAFPNVGLFFTPATGGAVSYLYRTGAFVPNPPGAGISMIDSGSISASGRAFVVPFSLNFPNGDAFYVIDLTNPGTPVTTLRSRTGDSVGPGLTLGGPDRSRGAAINLNGQIVYTSTILGTGVTANNDRGLFRVDPVAGYQIIAREGDPAPGMPGTFFETPGVPPFLLTLNNAGHVAFGWRIGAALGQGGVWAGGPSGIALVVKEGDPAPGGPAGSVFGALAEAYITPNDRVVFPGQILSSGGASLGTGLWLTSPIASGATPQLLARTGTPAPGLPAGLTIEVVPAGTTSPRTVLMNARGEVAFVAKLQGFSSTDFAVYAGAPGRIAPVLRVSDQIEIAPGVTKTVSIIQDSFGSVRSSGTQDGKPNLLNDLGQMLLTVQFTDSSWALLLFQLPHPCPGDANGDGVIDFLDLNVVLSFFGTSGPHGIPGDFNNDGAVDFLDLNAVLSFFGSAC